jgi:hypothetical protein
MANKPMAAFYQGCQRISPSQQWEIQEGLSTEAATSPDGINRTARTLPSSSQWVLVTYDNGVFVAIADNSNVAA